MSGYFDPAYFDPTYFDTGSEDTTPPPQPAAAPGGGRRLRPVYRPESRITDDPDAEWRLLLDPDNL